MKATWICAAGLLAALSVAETAPVSAQSGSQPSALVELTPLKQGNLPRLVRGFGRVIPAESAKTAITSDVAGVVTTVNVYQGEFVRKGDDLFTMSPSPDELSAYKQAQLAVNFAQKLLDATKSLVGEHLKTQSDLEAQQQALANAQLKLEALKKIGADGPRTIAAPHDAVILTLSVGPGSAVASGAQLVELANPKDLLLDAEVPPNEAQQITVGNDAKIVATDSGATFHGKVLSKGGVISTAGGLARVQVSIPQGKMLIGEHAMAIISERQMSGFIVPHEAVLVNDSGDTYVVQSVEGKAHLVPVKVVASQGGRDVVQGSLVSGADLVLAGNHQVSEGTRLRIEKTAQKPRAGSK